MILVTSLDGASCKDGAMIEGREAA